MRRSPRQHSIKEPRRRSSCAPGVCQSRSPVPWVAALRNHSCCRSKPEQVTDGHATKPRCTAWEAICWPPLASAPQPRMAISERSSLRKNQTRKFLNSVLLSASPASGATRQTHRSSQSPWAGLRLVQRRFRHAGLQKRETQQWRRHLPECHQKADRVGSALIPLIPPASVVRYLLFAARSFVNLETAS
jgi:hypothetical protein